MAAYLLDTNYVGLAVDRASLFSSPFFSFCKEVKP
jgi:hypothetical protein